MVGLSALDGNEVQLWVKPEYVHNLD